jgi:hypothetical protein
MTERLVAAFTSAGVPQTGLSATMTIYRESDDTKVIDAAAMTERGSGVGIRYTYDYNPTADIYYYWIANAGTDSIDNRYISGVIDPGINAILADTAEIGAAGAGLTEAGGTGDHLSAIPWNAAWDAEVQSEAADALTAYDPPTNAEMEARTLPAADYTIVSDLGVVQTADHAAAIADLPTNAELATALAGADDAVLAAIAALENLSSAGAQAAAEAALTAYGAALEATGQSIKGKTDNLPADPADQSAVEAAITAATSPLATSLELAALENISVADVLGGVVEGTVTLKHALQAIMSFVAGKADGGGTATITFRDQADTKDRITMTVDSSGNRTAVVLAVD